MISKIIAGDVFSTQLQAGESPDKRIDIIVATNTAGINTRGVAHNIGSRFNVEFHNLLQGQIGREEVPLGHVFSREGIIGGQQANFHAIAVNRRERPGGPQDWTQLLQSLTIGLDYLHVNQNTYDDDDVVDDSNLVDVELQEKIAGIKLGEGVDYAAQVSAIVKEHIERTRRKYRAVLVGGADGLKNRADLQHTLEAFESSGLILHLYLGHASVEAVRNVIPLIPSLRARELLIA